MGTKLWLAACPAPIATPPTPRKMPFMGSGSVRIAQQLGHLAMMIRTGRILNQTSKTTPLCCLMENSFEVNVGSSRRCGWKKFRVFLKEDYTQWDYITGPLCLQSWLNNYLDDLAKGKKRKRKPPGVLKVEELS
jgi:hypothetical protein